MAYICNKPPHSCSSCEHYRYDNDRARYACFAAHDKKDHERKKDNYTEVKK